MKNKIISSAYSALRNVRNIGAENISPREKLKNGTATKRQPRMDTDKQGFSIHAAPTCLGEAKRRRKSDAGGAAFPISVFPLLLLAFQHFSFQLSLLRPWQNFFSGLCQYREPRHYCLNR
jgi:hypothetical protein